MQATSHAGDTVVIQQAGVQQLIQALGRDGYRVIGPTVKAGAIVYDDVRQVEDLPVGWTETQDAGTYRLARRDDDALFGYVVGPQTWKAFLHPSALTLWEARRTAQGFDVTPEAQPSSRMAFLGVRGCDLHAIAIQDHIFLRGQTDDPAYAARRHQAFIIAVHCVQAGSACFCASMRTGPRAKGAYDLALTEVIDGPRHDFVVEVGSDRGAELMAAVPRRQATPELLQAREQGIARATLQMGRTMDTAGLNDLLARNLEHPRWDQIASRCLTCANCTMVCPTCFCTTVQDVTDLTGDHTKRVRAWDSCFTIGFSSAGGHSVRSSVKARYRQWLTHKLSAWIDQFGTSGCVGCGRCITWCPAAIDLTEEVRVIRASDGAQTSPQPKEPGHAHA